MSIKLKKGLTYAKIWNSLHETNHRKVLIMMFKKLCPNEYKKIEETGDENNHKILVPHLISCLSQSPSKLKLTYNTDNYKVTSLIKYFQTLVTFFKVIGNDKLQKQYEREVNIHRERKQEIQDKNELSEERLINFVTFPQIVQKREEFKTLSQQKPKDIGLHYKYLILSLVTYQPPLRANYHNMKIKEGGRRPNDKTNNFLWLNGENWVYLIYNDKVNKHKIHKKHFEIEIESQELQKIINDSIERFPRSYVLTPQTELQKPSSYQSYLQLLHYIWRDKKVGIDIIRSAYISEFYKTNRTTAEKKLLAQQMRHSVSTAEEVYRKINNEEVVVQEKQKSQSKVNSNLFKNYKTQMRKLRKSESKVKFNINELYKNYLAKSEIKTSTKSRSDARFDLKAWRKDYLATPESKQLVKAAKKRYYSNNSEKINRKKIIDNANRGQTVPSQASIKKYDLKYNDDTGIWE